METVKSFDKLIHQVQVRRRNYSQKKKKKNSKSVKSSFIHDPPSKILHGFHTHCKWKHHVCLTPAGLSLLYPSIVN